MGVWDSAPAAPLAGLRDIAWSELEHAYGAADDTPDALEALLSGDDDLRLEAIHRLYGTLHHQQSVFDASVAATPFLIALVDRDGQPDRGAIVNLLAQFAVHDTEQAGLADDLAEFRSIAFDAVAAGASTYRRLLSDPEPGVRVSAALVLAFLGRDPATLDALRTALVRETDRIALIHELVAIGFVGSGEDDELLTRQLAHDDELVRMCAAVALVRQHGSGVDPRALAVLDEVEPLDPIAAMHLDWRWSDEPADLADAVRTSVKGLDERLADLAAAERDGGDVVDAGSKVFPLLFVDDHHGPRHPWLPSELDERRRAVLTALTKVSDDLMPYWPYGQDSGLPQSTRDARRLLGLDHGPLDRAVLVGAERIPVWAAVYRVICARLPAADLHAALDVLPAEERLRLVDDGLDGAYDLTYVRGYASPDTLHLREDFTLLVADIVTRTGAVGADWARRTLDAQRTADEIRRTPRVLAAVIVLGRAAEAAGTVLDDGYDSLISLRGRRQPDGRSALPTAVFYLSPASRARLARTARPEREPSESGYDWWELIGMYPPDEAVDHVLDRLRSGPADDIPWDRAATILDASGPAGEAARAELAEVRQRHLDGSG